MSQTHLPTVDRLAEDLAHEIGGWDGPPGRIWRVTGDQTSGKSTLLRQLAMRLDNSVLIAPPARALDSAQVGMLQMCGALSDSGAANGELQGILEPARSWDSKIDVFRQWLAQYGSNLVLLCDEPLNWLADEYEESYFNDCTWAFINVLLDDAPCHRVVTGKLPGSRRCQRTEYLDLSSDPASLLDDADSWGTLAQAAASLRLTLGDRLREFTPLEIRLLVGHEAVAEAAGLNALNPGDATRRAISRRFAELLEGSERWRALRWSWARLALVRQAFDEQLLETLTGGDLEPLAADVLKHCLLFPEGSTWVLHEMLRKDALEHRWLPREEVRSSHLRLADNYHRSFEAAKDTYNQLVFESEAFHHASAAGDVSAMDHYRVYFVQQLDVLGRVLSHDIRDYRAATSVFQRSLEWDAEDAYAHHYLAFNLDVLAENADEVEKNYREAIRLQPRHPWWHSRLICFLIARGRTRDAERAWDEALDGLSAEPATSGVGSLYDDLHRWVAATLLHRGELDFAGRVLALVPERRLDEDPGFRALQRMLEALVDVEVYGAYVPASIMLKYTEWWREGPFLLPTEMRDGYMLNRWLAGRVDARENEVLHLRVADIHPGQEQRPAISAMALPVDKLEAWTLDGDSGQFRPGRFVEIGIYRNQRGQTNQRICLNRGRRWADLDLLPRLLPDPDRYLKDAAPATP